MKKLVLSVVLSVAVGFSLMHAQVLNRDPFEKLDPALDELISPRALLEQLATHFGFLEGPVWVDDGEDGYLVFADMAANVLYKWTPYEREFSVFFDRPGYTGHDFWTVGMDQNNGREEFFMHGSNGLALDTQGNFVVAGWGSRSIKRLEKDGSQTTLADRYDGKRFGGPNDLVVKKTGTIYFTDSVGGLRLREKDPARELMFRGVFMLKDGDVSLVGELGGANGILLSPDERYLYASSGGAKTIWRWDIQADDTTANGREFIDLSADERPGIIDGMKVDERGNIWASCCGGVHILTPEGKPLGMFRTPLRVTNLTFGGPDWKTLYITARSDLYRIRTRIPGIPGR